MEETMRITQRLAHSCFIVATLLSAGAVVAQDYPNRPIRLVVPSSPGTSPDLTSRIIAPELSKQLGQPVIVENKAGADMILGFEYVAKLVPADGYTISAAVASNLIMLPLTTTGLRFDPLTDLPPFMGFAEARLVLTSSASVPWKSFDEMIVQARANPGKFNYGASSPNIRLMMEVLLRRLNLNVVYIPYSAGAAYVQSLAAGNDIQLGFVSDTLVVNLGDKVRAIAITGDKRFAKLPSAPTLGELGYPKMPGLSFSLNARAGTPAPIVQRLYAAASRSMQQPEVRALFEKVNLVPMDESPEAAGRTFAEQAAFFSEIAKQVGIKPN